MCMDGNIFALQEGCVEIAETAAEDVEGGPPVRGSMLVVVAVGEGSENWDERSE